MSSPVVIVIVAVIAATLLAVALSAIAISVLRDLRRGPSSPPKGGRFGWVRTVGYSLMPALLCLALGALVLLGFLSVIGWGIVIFVLIEGARKYRATQQQGLLWLLTVSAERAMPLIPAVEAFAQELGGTFGRRARRLAGMLTAGVPLPDALDRCPGLLPRYAEPAIHVGCETGTLAQALRRAATVYDRDAPMWLALQGKIAYLLLLPAFGGLLLTFIMLKIIPSFETIFKDYGATLPPLTRGLIGVANLSVQFWFVLWPLYLLGPALLFYLPIRYFGWTDWDLPGMGRFTRLFDAAEILDTLALVAGQERPLPQAVAALAHAYPKKRIRLRLSQAAADMMLGGEWCECLYRYGVIRRPERAILQAAQRVGNLPWALREMADSVRRRLAYRVQAAAQMLFPPIVILMGLVVLFIVAALFVPIVALIQRLA